MKPTMALAEMVKGLRECGVSTSNDTEAAMIQQGQYPFANCCKTKIWNYRVWTVKYEKWKAERGLVPQPKEAEDMTEFEKAVREFEEAKSLDAACEADSDAKPKSEYINDNYNYEEIKNIASHGLAKDHFKIGDKLKVDRNGKDIIFDVVKATDTGIVLLSHYLIAQMPFDAPEPRNPDEYIATYGSNNYEESSVRQWLNSNLMDGEWWSPMNEYDEPIACKDYMNGFMYSMDESFIDCLSEAIYNDLFFLPSEEEIEKWLPNAKGRKKTYVSSEHDWYWSRTPYASDSYYVRDVNTDGTLSGSYVAYYGGGVAPACVIGRIL